MTKTFFDKNYFEIFSLPVQFEVDEDTIRKTYLNLQRALHPDRFGSASAHEKRLAVQMTATLNTAYKTLLDPVKRALYLLTLHGDPVGEQTVPVDAEFLSLQMEWREGLASGDERVKQRIEEEKAVLLERVKKAFDEEGDVAAAKDLTVKLQFINKLSG